MELDEYYNYLINSAITTEETLRCITGIFGYNEEILNDVLYYFSGYRDIENYVACEDTETYIKYFREE